MKYKTTRRAVVDGTAANYLVCAGYCDLSHLLRGHEPQAYTAGIYGWNFDIYHVHGLTICTGYRNMPGRRAANIREYETKARAIWEDYGRPYEERREDVEKLLGEFCAQA